MEKIEQGKGIESQGEAVEMLATHFITRLP